MNQITPDRHHHIHIPVSGTTTLIAGQEHIPAKLEYLSFSGLRCRTAPGALAKLDHVVEGIKLEDLPALHVTPRQIDGDVLSATYDNRELAGRITASYIELFQSTKG